MVWCFLVLRICLWITCSLLRNAGGGVNRFPELITKAIVQCVTVFHQENDTVNGNVWWNMKHAWFLHQMSVWHLWLWKSISPKVIFCTCCLYFKSHPIHWQCLTDILLWFRTQYLHTYWKLLWHIICPPKFVIWNSYIKIWSIQFVLWNIFPLLLSYNSHVATLENRRSKHRTANISWLTDYIWRKVKIMYVKFIFPVVFINCVRL